MPRKIKYVFLGLLIIVLGALYYGWTRCYGITPYRFSDREAILKMLHDNWYWMVSESSVDFSAEYEFDHLSVGPEYPDGSMHVFVYRVHGKPVGFITYYRVDRDRSFGVRARIQFLFVLEEYRKRGYAQKMLSYVMDDALKNGIFVIELVTRVNNTGARRLYQRCGFKETHEDDGFIGFEKFLTGPQAVTCCV